MPVSAYHIRPGHLKLIAFNYARNLIRGGTGIMFTLAVLVVGLTIAAIFITPLEALHKSVQQENRAFMEQRGIKEGREVTKKELVEKITEEIGRPVARWATGGDVDQVNFLTRTRPALVSAILMVLLFAMPFLVCLGAFNQLSGDIQYKGLRYLLLRTERANLFLGRFLGTVLFTIVVVAILFAVLFLYLAFKANYYPVGDVALWLLQGYVAVILFSLPYIALCSWISSALDSPFGSLAICELIAIFIPAFVAIGSNVLEQFKYLGYVMPWPLKYQLLHPNALHFLGATLAILAFTALFGWLGLRNFQYRDL
jgi:ABC-2 type transport system permease protein